MELRMEVSLLFQGILFTVVYGKLNLLSLGVARHAPQSSIPPAKHIQYVPAIGILKCEIQNGEMDRVGNHLVTSSICLLQSSIYI